MPMIYGFALSRSELIRCSYKHWICKSQSVVESLNTTLLALQAELGSCHLLDICFPQLNWSFLCRLPFSTTSTLFRHGAEEGNLDLMRYAVKFVDKLKEFDVSSGKELEAADGSPGIQYIPFSKER